MENTKDVTVTRISDDERTIFYEDEAGTEHRFVAPTHWEICSTCHGEGKHAHAVDGNGITGSEWAEWADEERETYLSGGYDRTCEECDGSGKYRVVNHDELPSWLQAAVDRYWRDEAAYRAEVAAERRMGC